jgi:hypothetical protein
VVDDLDPWRDLVEQLLRGVAPMMAEGAVVLAEQAGVGGHGDECRRAR